MKEVDEEFLNSVIKTFGTPNQIDMVREECLELLLALQRLKRGKEELNEIKTNIIDEVADVLIVINQARLIFGKKEVDERIEYKINRLKSKL